MHQDIIDAITHGRVLRFTYDGEDRWVEPHYYGKDTKGHDALRAFQRDKGWRLFHTSKIARVVWDGTKFSGNRPGYSGHDKAMVSTYARR